MNGFALKLATPVPVGIVAHLSFRAYSDDAHPFLFGTFSESLRGLPGIASGERDRYEHALKRLMRDPSTSAVLVTPRGAPDEFMGWAVATPTCLVYAYVRFQYRRGKIGAHVGSSLIEATTGRLDVSAAMWTLDASRMAAHGYPIRYDLDEHIRFQQLAR